MEIAMFHYFSLLLLACARTVITISTTEVPTTTTKFVLGPQAYGRTSQPDSWLNKKKFFFEGVDYDMMPEKLFVKNDDCYSVFLDCLRSLTVIIPVCAWYQKDVYFYEYPTTCDIDLQNCLYREANGYGKGDYIGRNYFYYNGDGSPCYYFSYSKADQNRERDAYFGKFAEDSLLPASVK